MTKSFGILYVDGNQETRGQFQSDFGPFYPIKTCQTGFEALQILQKEGDRYSLLVADSKLSDFTGTELCEKVAALKPQMTRILLTAFNRTTPNLLTAIQRGQIHNYIAKPWKKEALKPVLDKAARDFDEMEIKIQELQVQASKFKALVKEIREVETIIGENSGLQEVMGLVKKVASTDSTILIRGETGTGKELIARAIHDQSRRKSGPFVPVHCASLAKTLMESELFGHEKGAFTGADQQHLGRFEIADGGTIFLDEIGELTEEIQVKLLRVLQEREINRVGSNRPIVVNVRLLAATHRNLEEMVRSGSFREDLYYRLNVISLKVPALREREEDIPLLAEHFIKTFCQETFKNLTLAPETFEYLSRYDWPGNVRELQNIIERAVILCEGPMIYPKDLNLQIDQSLRVNKSTAQQPQPIQLKSQIQEENIQELAKILKKAKGNISEAARMMNIPRSTLFHQLRKHQLV